MHMVDSERALGSSVLVLNRCYAAVHVVNVRRAFCLLVRDLAEVIHIEDGRYSTYDFTSWLAVSELAWKDPGDERNRHVDWIQTVRFSVQVPRIIRLTGYDRMPRQTLRFNRRNLFARDNNSCQYCGETFPTSQLSIDHVVPRSRGGPTTWENVVCSCLDCNTKKGGRTPQEARMNLRTKPAKPSYNPLLAAKLSNPKYASWRDFVAVGRGSNVDW
ncbi:MAG TPA: HNH endonuclease [Pirellulaceae bacterium]|nr:HNH endonuclease [Pirellulaceae bacterium]